MLCLPVCDKDCWQKLAMWHGVDLHIGKIIDLPDQIEVPAPLDLEPGGDIPPPAPLPPQTSSSCLDDGWPYCFFDAVQWAQAAADIQLLFKGFTPLADDVLVLHIRSGDVILAENDWLTQDATNAEYDEKTIAGAPVQPACAYYMDVIMRANGGQPFKKVHLLADQHCSGDGLDSRGDNTMGTRADGKCGSTNPCIADIIRKIPTDMIVPTPDMTNSELFKRDCSLIA
jgi:hypothetical protein